MKNLKIAMLALSALALAACGSSVSSKEDAAKAMNRLSETNSSATTSAKQSGLTQDFSIGATVTVNGKEGSAKVTAQVTTDIGEGGISNSASFDIEYSEFSTDGENVFDGKVTYTVGQKISLGSIEQVVTMKGNVEMTGEFDSQLETDVKIVQSIAATESSAKVTMTITGTVKADGENYDFQNEQFTVDVSRD